jgi:hypothetical protein
MASKVSLLHKEQVALANLTPHPENARHGDQLTIERSLRQLGQYNPLLVQEGTCWIVRGNNTYRVMRDRLGWTHAEVLWVRCDGSQARAILAVDNRSNDLATYNDEALLQLLDELNKDDMLSIAGYVGADIEELVAKLELLEQPPPRADPFDVPEARDDDVPTRLATEGKAAHMIMLSYTSEVHAEVSAGLEQIGRRQRLSSHAEVVRYLVAQARDSSVGQKITG